MEAKEKMKVYFAHPRKSETDGSAKMVIFAIRNNLWDWVFVNPFNSPLTKKWYENLGDQEIANEIVDGKDLPLIESCDMVFAYLPFPSIGTAIEIWESCRRYYKPVVVLTEITHPWLIASGAIITRTVDQAILTMKGFASLKTVEEA